MVKFLTLNSNFEGLLSPTRLEQSLCETLDYIARLTWNCVLKSNWFGKSVLKRFGTLPKKPWTQNLAKMILTFNFSMVYAYAWNQQ